MRVTSSLTEGDADAMVLEENQLSLVRELDHTDVVGSTQVEELLGASACDAPQDVLVRWENISISANSEKCETCIPVRTMLGLTMLMYSEIPPTWSLARTMSRSTTAESMSLVTNW
jgi:hypothetical protein